MLDGSGDLLLWPLAKLSPEQAFLSFYDDDMPNLLRSLDILLVWTEEGAEAWGMWVE